MIRGLITLPDIVRWHIASLFDLSWSKFSYYMICGETFDKNELLRDGQTDRQTNSTALHCDALLLKA